MISDRDPMRANRHRDPVKRMPRLPRTPLGWVMLVNIAIFVLQQLQLGFQPVLVGGKAAPAMGFAAAHLASPEIWTLITHQFVHVNLMHLIMNLFIVWLAGKQIQNILGGGAFLSIYLLGGVAGALLHALSRLLVDEGFYLCGASGAGFALLVAFAMLMPGERIFALLFFVIPVSLTVKNLALGLVGFEVITGSLDLLLKMFHTRSAAFGFLVHGIAHFAHLGGALLGYLYMRKLGYGGPFKTLDQLRETRSKKEKSITSAAASKRRRRSRPAKKKPCRP